MKNTYICPKTNKQCVDECCVSAENCNIGEGILSEPTQDNFYELLGYEKDGAPKKNLEKLSYPELGQEMANFWKKNNLVEITQETLEEAAEKYTIDSPQMSEIRKIAFKNGAKWQQERMYSEEEVIKIVEKSKETGLTAEYLLLTEQFKKK